MVNFCSLVTGVYLKRQALGTNTSEYISKSHCLAITSKITVVVVIIPRNKLSFQNIIQNKRYKHKSYFHFKMQMLF